MNHVTLMGRLTRDPELRQSPSGIPVVSFTVAVNRRFKDANGEYKADFISCTAWRNQAEFIHRYFRKGHRILLSGSIQSSNWTDPNGQKHYRTDVIVEEVEFVELKGSNPADMTAGRPAAYENPQSADMGYSQSPQVNRQSNRPTYDVGEDDFSPGDVASLPFDL